MDSKAMLDSLYARNTNKKSIEKWEHQKEICQKAILDILASGYENQFYTTRTCAKENTYGAGFAVIAFVSQVLDTCRQAMMGRNVGP